MLMSAIDRPFDGPQEPGAPGPDDQLEEAGGLQPALLRYWQAVVRWRLVIAGIIVACLVVGVIATLLKAPLYTARTQIEISREQKNVTNVEGLESQQEGRDLEFYATQYALLRAESLAERVARQLDLARSDAFFEAHGVEPVAPADGSGGSAAPSSQALRKRERQAVTLLLKHVDVVPVRMSRLVDVQYTSRSPQMSARIANAWTREFIGDTMDRQFASTADARRFLEQRLAALRTKLEQSERDVVRYASNKDIVTLDTVRDQEGRTFTQRTLASTDLEQLNEALASARADRIAAESKAREGSAEYNAEVLTNPAIADLRAKREEAAAQYSQLMVRFEPGYPAARALSEQIKALDRAIARETNRITGSRRQGYAEALARENELQGRVNALKQQLDTQRQDSIQYNIYQREADTNRQLYDALLQRYKEIGVAGTVGASNIAIVDSAKVPNRPSSPNMLLNLALALLAGMAIAALTVFALEQIDEGVRNPDDVRAHLKLPLLGNVPLAGEEPLRELEDPKSHIAEAYFSVRSTLAFATTHGLPRSLAVTSTREGEGKSTTALALAEVIGRTGKRVLLIDGDLRSPSQHRFLAAGNERGLSNLLAGDDDLAEAVQPTAHRGLSLLSTGPLPPSPAELLSTERLGELLGGFLARFDHVVIDAPPVLGIADAPLIGRSVEGLVYVVEAETTPRRAVRAALQRLRGVGNHVFGVVVTKVDFSRHSYGYGYGYGYGRLYGYGEAAQEGPVAVQS
jgi:capsular exopolysaccharide synthesis family protein